MELGQLVLSNLDCERELDKQGKQREDGCCETVKILSAHITDEEGVTVEDQALGSGV